jgi:hypothetical protein
MLADFSYALSNPHEFLSEAFGDAAFRRALAGIKDPGKTGNILTNFVEAIKKLFKDVYDFDISDSMLESIFTATSQTLSPSSVQTETREQKEQKVVKKYRRRQIDVDGLPVQSLSQPLKKGVTKKYVSTRQSTDNNTSWETVVEEVDAVEIGEYEGYSIYAYKSQAGHYVVFEESTGISIGLPDVKSQKDAKARFKNHIKKNSKGQPFKKVLDETVSPVRKMNAEIAALETTEETTEETTTDTTTEVTNSDLDLLKKYKKTRKDVNNIFELKDWALKEPIQNGDTTITHIIPDPASGTFDVIFDRKETGNWKAKFRFKNGKLKLDLYTNQGTINAPSFVSPSEYSQDFMDKSIAAAIPSDLISSIENDLRSVPKQTDSKMNPTDFAYTESIDKKYGISKTLGDVINELKGATPTTTTENKGKAVVEKIKADVKEKGIKVQKDKNGNQTDFYIDKLKNTWKRVTSFCNPMDPASKKKVVVQSSLKIGNKVDDLIRDFFEEGSTLSSKDDLGYLHDKYQLGDGGMTAKFLKQLEGLREYFKQRGENVVASGIILHSDELGVAGTVDLLTYDNNGDIRIYDIKTMKSNQLVNSYKGYDTVIYDTDYIDPISGKKNRSNRKKHTDQLSAYNLILEKTYGVKAVQLGILPVEVSYGKTKVVSETKKLDLVSPAEGFFIDIKNDPDVLIKAAARNKKTDSKKTTVKKVEEPSEITEEKAIEEDRKLGAVTGLERLKQKRREREAREARNKGKNVKKTPVKKTIENKVKDKIDKLIVEDDIGDGLDLNVDDIGTTQEFDPEKENEVSNKRGPKPKPAESRIQPADKVIWAHPTMGKTTLRKTNDNVLDFDTDYKPAIAKELGLPKNKQNSVGLNEARAGNPAFNERFKVAMRKAWTKAKQEAKAQDKALLVSDMMFLEENGQDFDRVVTTSAETFKTRSDNRGDNLFGISEYKSSLDEKVSKVSKDKVITTDKYLSEIFPSSETPRGLMPKSASPNEGTITQQEIDEVANMVPANVATEVIEDYVTLLDGGQAVVGLFQAGLVTISRKAQSGDGYHEAFHAVFRTMLNTKQQQELLQEARDMFMPLESEIENLRILHGISEEAAEDLFYEEQLADEFGVYASNPRAYPFNGKKGRQNYFERLLAWINDILGVTGNIEKIFKNVKQGNFNKANNVDLLIQSRVVESVNDKTGKPC